VADFSITRFETDPDGQRTVTGWKVSLDEERNWLIKGRNAGPLTVRFRVDVPGGIVGGWKNSVVLEVGHDSKGQKVVKFANEDVFIFPCMVFPGQAGNEKNPPKDKMEREEAIQGIVGNSDNAPLAGGGTGISWNTPQAVGFSLEPA
jgi:hypothetical protein